MMKNIKKTEDKFQKKINEISNKSLKEEMSAERHNAIVSTVRAIADVGSFIVMIIISMALGIYGLAAWAVSFIVSTMIGIGAGKLVSNKIKKNEEKKYGYSPYY